MEKSPLNIPVETATSLGPLVQCSIDPLELVIRNVILFTPVYGLPFSL